MKRAIVALSIVGGLFASAMCLAQEGTVSGKIKLSSDSHGHPTGNEICKHITVAAETHRGSKHFPGYSDHDCAGPKKATGSWTNDHKCAYTLAIPHGCFGKDIWVSGAYSGPWSEQLGGGWVVVDPEGWSNPFKLTDQDPSKTHATLELQAQPLH